MKVFAEDFGLNLNGSWNKELMHHHGRHPNEYHDFVLSGMKMARKEAGGDKEKFLKLFEKYIKTPVINNPNLLNKTGWE